METAAPNTSIDTTLKPIGLRPRREPPLHAGNAVSSVTRYDRRRRARRPRHPSRTHRPHLTQVADKRSAVGLSVPQRPLISKMLPLGSLNQAIVTGPVW